MTAEDHAEWTCRSEDLDDLDARIRQIKDRVQGANEQAGDAVQVGPHAPDAPTARWWFELVERSGYDGDYHFKVLVEDPKLGSID